VESKKNFKDGMKDFFSFDLSTLKGHYEGLLLMLDFDGTLVPIMNNPADCYLSPEIRRYLSMICHAKGFAVAVISGRSLSDVRKRVPVRGIYYSGSHGLEIFGPTFNFAHPDAVHMKAAIDRLRKLIMKRMGHIEGLTIEKKRFSFSCHYRMMEKRNVGKMTKKLIALLSEDSDHEHITVMRGKKVIEVIPGIDWNKGNAVKVIMDHLRHKFIPVYVGDDTTDEFAFRALNNIGLTVRVGRSKKSFASYYIREQKDIVQFLRYIYNSKNVIIQKKIIQAKKAPEKQSVNARSSRGK